MGRGGRPCVCGLGRMWFGEVVSMGVGEGSYSFGSGKGKRSGRWVRHWCG